MRLLTTKEPYAFVKTDSYLPYAILSHTWVHTAVGEATEITYQELCAYMNDDSKRKAIAARPEFDKIRQATRLAARGGHRYIWLDTCCIDKTNILELDESIRCMFQWYRDATICLAYLSDVGPVIDADVEIGLGFETSRWFTRGWTLQELLAPRDVVFFAKDWSFLGFRMGRLPFFQRALSKASAIDEDVLFGGSLPSEFSISTRMQWASGRTTTRIEDTAYCLMGLFGVHMPIMYGEGEAAFIRLQEEILKSSDDHSIFAWFSPNVDADQLCGLLADSPLRFKDVRPIRQFLPSNDVGQPAEEWRVTNIGLRLKLLVFPLDSSETETADYGAKLPCFFFGGPTPLMPVIRLRRLWGDQFARIGAHTLAWHADDLEPPGLRHTMLYVKQDPTFRLPQITIADEHPSADESTTYRLRSVYPPAFWHRRRFFRATSRDLRYPIGLFRFSRWLRKTLWVDVAVGFRSQGPEMWKVWHIQRWPVGASLHMDSIEEAYDEIVDYIRQVQTFPERLERPGQIRGLCQLYGDRDAWAIGDYIDSRVVVTVPQPSRKAAAGLPSFMLELRHIPELELDSEPVAEVQMKPSTQSTYDLTERMDVDLCSSEFPKLARRLATCTIPWELPLDSAPDMAVFMRSVRVGPLDCLQLRNTISDKATESLLDGSDLSGVSDRGEFMQACIRGDVEKVNAMLKPRKTRKHLVGSRQPSTGFTGLHWAAACGHAKLVQRLVHFDTSTKATRATTTGGWTACQLAVALGHQSVMDILVKHERHTPALGRLGAAVGWKKADIGTGESIYHIAATVPHLYTHNILGGAFWLQPERAGLTRRARYPCHMVNTRGETLLHRAAAAGNIDVVTILLEKTTSVLDAVDGHGRTPLWHAAAGGHEETVLLLIKHDPVIDAQDVIGLSPLHIACWNGHAEAVRTLLAHHADPHIGTYVYRFTPAHFAFYGQSGQSSECISLLENRGADMNALSLPHWCAVSPADMQDFVATVFHFLSGR